MSQFEQENDLGRGGGDVDDETMEAARETAEEREEVAGPGDGGAAQKDEGPGPWAKTTSGDV